MKITRIRTLVFMLVTAVCAATGCSDSTPADNARANDPGGHAAAVNDIADRYYAWQLERLPELAYFRGIEVDRHDGLFDNSLPALAASETIEDGLREELAAVDIDSLRGSAEWITAVLLQQQLEADRRTRVCRQELWNISQMGGWHSLYSQVATLQPVATAAEREQALARWSKFAAFVDQEIENLRRGIEQGYSAPKAVVGRVIDQLDGLLGLATADSPYASPAARSEDEAFSASMLAIVEDEINPALQRLRDYLAGDYMGAAREALTITANPDGLACYEASLFAYTTLDRSGKDVYELGRQTVAANRARVVELGQDKYLTDDFAEIIRRTKADPADSFASKEELLEFSRAMVRRAEAEMPNWVATMPSQPVEVVPFPEHEEGTGRSAHYRVGTDDRPGEYRIPLHKPEEQSRGNAEATAFHEAWPGHHLQVASARAVEGKHPVTKIIWFSGPGEGWARYSEALAEEMGLYTTETGPILRRAWPATGMVVDPGIHLFGWTREQASEYMNETGRFPASMGDEMVDRIAILPGQLTAYDSGGLEIVALRRQAEAALGDAFDIREFHDRVLENGTIPLGALRQHIEAWIAASQPGAE